MAETADFLPVLFQTANLRNPPHERKELHLTYHRWSRRLWSFDLMKELQACQISLRELGSLWQVVSAWAHGLRKVPVKITFEPTGPRTGLMTVTVVPSVANLLLYAVHESKGWNSYEWPGGRELANNSPLELFLVLIPGARDEDSNLYGIPSELILYILELYLATVYEELFKKPYSTYNISFEKIQAIAKVVRPRSLAKLFSGTVKEVLGTAKTMGFAVDLQDPTSVQKKIDAGVYVCDETVPSLWQLNI